MKLDSEFIRLPLDFDAARLAGEVAAIAESDWRPHPQGFPGNSALPLIALGGDPADDGVIGPMRPTPHLAQLPYVRQILASLGVPLGRTRLMRLVGQAEATQHVDTNYYWMRRVRVHVPVLTTPDVMFHCGSRQLHMAAGEAWLFDTWRMHNVVNPAPTTRIHLVADTVGSPAFWQMVAGSARPFAPQPGGTPARFVPFDPAQDPALGFENVNFPVVMSPEEQGELLGLILGELPQNPDNRPEDIAAITALLERFARAWKAKWTELGADPEAWPEYRQLLDRLTAEMAPAERMAMPNGTGARECIMQCIVRPGHNPDLAEVYARAGVVPAAARRDRLPAPSQAAAGSSRFDRPVFIVSAPRSGSSLLFETLARSPDFWSLGGEGHEVFERVAKLTPERKTHHSNRLDAEDATPAVVAQLQDAFLSRLRSRERRILPADNSRFRMLEKTPKNALRVDFLAAAFPDARFIYLHREPRDNLSSMLDAWRSGRFVTYPKLAGWTGGPWSLLLTPGWQALAGKPLPEVVAQQWMSTQQQLLASLQQLPDERWCAVRYEDFLAEPQRIVEQICAFCDVGWDQPLDGPLPLSQHTLTAPDPDKWKKNSTELEQMLPQVEAVAAQARARAEAHAVSRKAPKVDVHRTAASRAAAPVVDPKMAEFGSEHTTNLVPLLQQLGISVLVSTYQAGKLIMLRVDNGQLNTHFRLFQKPMGMAWNGRKLAIGSTHSIHRYSNIPDVARKLEPAGKYDGCFVPQNVHVTGDVDVHEMGWGSDGELWFINTRFSTLCTLDREHSFVPRWRPGFVTALTPEDRCHLNGLAMVNGRPKYVTALAQTDTAQGWRPHKAGGGVLIDLDSNQVLCRGLSMPHSPRWHDGKLWVLESGTGAFSMVDLASGRLINVATLPGFTRGIDFIGPYAFIGLSQVRETAVFSGIPITEQAQERNCGVWIVDTRSGRLVGFLRFKGSVQEIFAVQVLPGIRFPELLDSNDEKLATSYILPDAALRDVPRLRA